MRNNEIEAMKTSARLHEAESRLLTAYAFQMALGMFMIVIALFAQKGLVIGALGVMGLVFAFVGFFKARTIAEKGVHVPLRESKMMK